MVSSASVIAEPQKMARVMRTVVTLCVMFGPIGLAISSIPYPKAEKPVSELKIIAETGRSDAELLALDTLAGNLARR